MPKVKNQMSLEDRKNLELMYRNLVFLDLAIFAAAVTCFITVIVINIQAPTLLGVIGTAGLILMGVILLRGFHFIFEKMKRIRKILGMHKTAKKYGLG